MQVPRRSFFMEHRLAGRREVKFVLYRRASIGITPSGPVYYHAPWDRSTRIPGWVRRGCRRCVYSNARRARRSCTRTAVRRFNVQIVGTPALRRPMTLPTPRQSRRGPRPQRRSPTRRRRPRYIFRMTPPRCRASGLRTILMPRCAARLLPVALEQRAGGDERRGAVHGRRMGDLQSDRIAGIDGLRGPGAIPAAAVARAAGGAARRPV